MRGLEPFSSTSARATTAGGRAARRFGAPAAAGGPEPAAGGRCHRPPPTLSHPPPLPSTGKVVPFVPPPEGGRLHLSQAVLVPTDASSDAAGRAIVLYRQGDEPEIAIASLRGDGKGDENANLDLIFDEYTEFFVKGPASLTSAVHLTGYHLPDFGGGYGDGSETESEDEGLGFGVGGESDSDDAPAGVPIRSRDDSDDNDDLSSSDSEADRAAAARQGVVIEELPAGAPPRPAKTASSSDFDSDEVSSGSSGSPDSGGESASGDESDGEPPVAAPAWGGAAKRKGGDAPAAPAAKKEKPAPAAKKEKPAPAAKPAAPAAKKEKPAPAAKPAAPAAKKQATTPTPAPPATPASAAKPATKVRRFDNGFIIEELAPGKPAGARAAPGKRVEVRYVGRLAKTGKVFDATKGKATFKFRVGVGEVIKGWDRGLAGAVEGATLRLTVPPAMGYGAGGAKPAIPGNATLVFDVEVVRVL